MELITAHIPRQRSRLVLAPIGDFQWNGPNGATAENHLKDHIARVLDLDGWFIGMGDYIDFASPSNRAKMRAADFYDTTQKAIDDTALRLVEELYEKFLAPSKGRWLGILHGHHYSHLLEGGTTDTWLAKKLGTRYLGTSAHLKVEFKDLNGEPHFNRLWVHHGTGNSSTPGGTLNKLEKVAGGWAGVDAFVMGHTTKLATSRQSRPFVNWKTQEMEHHDYLLVNCGGFSRSNTKGSKLGTLPHGDYAEVAMLPPSPLASPLLIATPLRGKGRAYLEALI